MKLENPLKQRCATCRFTRRGYLRANGQGPIIRCKRYPAEAKRVSPDNWCGEYQRSLVKTFNPMQEGGES